MSNREKLVELLTEYYGADPAYYDVDAPSIADHLIANGVVVREKGEWVLTDARFAEMSCSLCGFTYYGEYDKECMSDFCPNCGGDMRKGENDG